MKLVWDKMVQKSCIEKKKNQVLWMEGRIMINYEYFLLLLLGVLTEVFTKMSHKEEQRIWKETNTILESKEEVYFSSRSLLKL